jgi:hypothetical protein
MWGVGDWNLRTPQAILHGVVKPINALLHLRFFPIAVGIALLAGCPQQAVQSQAMPKPAPTAAANDANRGVTRNVTPLLVWYLLGPPERAYASDRSPMMGGPLATSGISENRGAYDVYSLTQTDTSASLSQWTQLRTFNSERECEDYKSSQLKDVNDPAWITKEAGKKRNRLMYQSAQRDFIESERCAAFEPTSSH